MRKSVPGILLSLAALIASSIIASALVSRGRAYEGIPQTEDAKLIQEVVEKSYEIEAIAARTFDLSSFPSVFVNDPRGGELSSSTVEFVQSVYKDYSTQYFGYLDYKTAYYSWWKSGALRLEELQTNAAREKRSLTEDELRSLIDDDGRIAMPRSQGTPLPPTLEFTSIEVEGDEAIVVFDDGLRVNQMVLVKIDAHWYIAGNRILSLHP